MPLITTFISKHYGVDWTKYELINYHDDDHIYLMCQENAVYANSIWFREVTKTNPMYLSYSKIHPDECEAHFIINLNITSFINFFARIVINLLGMMLCLFCFLLNYVW
jgi:hypothetical protein